MENGRKYWEERTHAGAPASCREEAVRIRFQPRSPAWASAASTGPIRKLWLPFATWRSSECGAECPLPRRTPSPVLASACASRWPSSACWGSACNGTHLCPLHSPSSSWVSGAALVLQSGRHSPSHLDCPGPPRPPPNRVCNVSQFDNIHLRTDRVPPTISMTLNTQMNDSTQSKREVQEQFRRTDLAPPWCPPFQRQMYAPGRR